jgi:elongation factor P--beta-lysine ligase
MMTDVRSKARRYLLFDESTAQTMRGGSTRQGSQSMRVALHTMPSPPGTALPLVRLVNLFSTVLSLERAWTSTRHERSPQV